MYYDPMIAKLVTYGEDRTQAISRMKDALDEYVIEGVSHNIALLHDIMENETYISGETNTDFINNEYPSGFAVNFTPEKEKELLCLTAFIHDAYRRRAGAFDGEAGPVEGYQQDLEQVESLMIRLGKVKHTIKSIK
jgi:propionyl-CoA carboxylase alpha chain